MGCRETRGKTARNMFSHYELYGWQCQGDLLLPLVYSVLA
jgi:hypothetical protein